MSSGAAIRVRCPDCSSALGPLGEAGQCGRCGRKLELVDGVWDLRPVALDAAQRAEDDLHADGGLPTWRRLFFHKRYWIEWCDTRWLPEIVTGRTRAFLEIGGGLCYASALAKTTAPGATVVATDVSPRYLARHAIGVGAMLEAPADVYAAADAERLPFEDGQFDAVYSQVVLYRVGDPARALREIWRVLAPGGRYVGIERASPWAPSALAREARVMAGRAERHGIRERPFRYAEWTAVLTAAGFGPDSVAFVPGRRVGRPWLQRLGNAVRPMYVAIRLAR
jgi:SAM-dependent methyltransferase